MSEKEERFPFILGKNANVIVLLYGFWGSSAVPLRSLYDFAADLIFNSEAERKKNRTGTESDPEPNQIRIRLNSVGKTDPQRQTIFALYFNETAFYLGREKKLCSKQLKFC
jgi:hypothetical protein